jgi:WD40 repeat protein
MDHSNNFEKLYILAGHEHRISSMIQQDSYLISVSFDGTVKIWDLERDFKCVLYY